MSFFMNKFCCLFLVWESIFPCTCSVLLVKMGMVIDGPLCWVCEMVEDFPFLFFFILQRQHYFTQGHSSGFIDPCSSCVWLCLNIKLLVGIAINLLWVQHSVNKCIPFWPTQKKDQLLICSNCIFWSMFLLFRSSTRGYTCLEFFSIQHQNKNPLTQLILIKKLIDY